MDKQLHELEEQLRDLLAEHEAMLALVRRKREAVRHARPNQVSDCTTAENAHVRRIGEIETRRQHTVAAISRAIDPAATEPMRLGRIAERVDEPRRGRLLALQAQLMQRMQEIQRESRIVRQAMDGLLKHVQGMVQVVAHTLGGQTYCQRGRVAAAQVSSFAATG